MSSVTFACIIKDQSLLSKYSIRSEHFDDDKLMLSMAREEMPEGFTYVRRKEKRSFYVRKVKIKRIQYSFISTSKSKSIAEHESFLTELQEKFTALEKGSDDEIGKSTKDKNMSKARKYGKLIASMIVIFNKNLIQLFFKIGQSFRP